MENKKCLCRSDVGCSGCNPGRSYTLEPIADVISYPDVPLYNRIMRVASGLLYQAGRWCELRSFILPRATNAKHSASVFVNRPVYEAEVTGDARLKGARQLLKIAKEGPDVAAALVRGLSAAKKPRRLGEKKIAEIIRKAQATALPVPVDTEI